MCAADDPAGKQARSSRLRSCSNAFSHRCASIDNRFDGRASANEILDGRCYLVANAKYDGTVTRYSRVTVEIGADGAGQHHARSVIVAEHQRPLDGTSGKNTPFGEDAPESVTRFKFRWHRKMIVDALDGGVCPAVVDPNNGRA